MMAELAARRRALGLTLTDAARKLKVGASSLSRYERGVRLAPVDFRKRYDILLTKCERGTRAYRRCSCKSKVVRFHDLAESEEFVLSAEVRGLRGKINNLGLSYLILRDITGFGLRGLRSRLEDDYPMARQDYTVIVNAIYDLEQGGMHRSMKKNERTKVALMLRYFRRRMDKLTALQEMYAALSEELSVQAQVYGAFRPSAGGYSDPVAEHYARLERLKQKIEYYRARVDPVRSVAVRLKNSKSERARVLNLVFERHFQEGESIAGLAQSLGIPERTLYRRVLELEGLVYQEMEDAREHGKKGTDLWYNSEHR